MFRWLQDWYRRQREAVIRQKEEELRLLRIENELSSKAFWREFGDEPFELTEKEYRRMMKRRSQLGAARFDEQSCFEFGIDPSNPRVVRHKPPQTRIGSDEEGS